jgi:hypothetical protein
MQKNGGATKLPLGRCPNATEKVDLYKLIHILWEGLRESRFLRCRVSWVVHVFTPVGRSLLFMESASPVEEPSPPLPRFSRHLRPGRLRYTLFLRYTRPVAVRYRQSSSSSGGPKSGSKGAPDVTASRLTLPFGADSRKCSFISNTSAIQGIRKPPSHRDMTLHPRV